MCEPNLLRCTMQSHNVHNKNTIVGGGYSLVSFLRVSVYWNNSLQYEKYRRKYRTQVSTNRTEEKVGL